MERKDKLLERLRRRPRDFTWDELTTLLLRLGFRQVRTGKAGGSRCRFIRPDGCLISLHELHPGRILKRYRIDQILETIDREGMLRRIP
jgi:predicted RNA binding protein YcfA (HicA-like mRNA interferase family)